MAGRTATSSRPSRRVQKRQIKQTRRRSLARRRTIGFIFILLIVGGIAFAVSKTYEKGYRELALPLRHDDIIRQQAEAKNLDPALIAAVIYQESRFRPRESSAGALGLMQLLPDTAHFIAGRTGGSKFTTEDLATPQINIAYGAWYLRHLLDEFDDDEITALAAYNAGIGNVQKWLAEKGETTLSDPDDIPFPETREYVKNVLKARDQYRVEYAKELAQ
ncbi:MAG: lytic transglycosylase domain-containing protein [Thermoleophilaceae bacterium]|nr:lytic transglycosylase domain-containing protein [Thermoleophilaceae bacterium]